MSTCISTSLSFHVHVMVATGPTNGRHASLHVQGVCTCTCMCTCMCVVTVGFVLDTVHGPFSFSKYISSHSLEWYRVREQKSLVHVCRHESAAVMNLSCTLCTACAHVHVCVLNAMHTCTTYSMYDN